jgi:hypothetical protein
MNCLNCGKEVKQTPGKRAKAYCDPNCRQRHWLKNNKKKSGRGPGRPKKTPLIDPSSPRDNPLINAARGRDSNGINMDEVRLAEKEASREFIEDQIKDIKAEKIPPQRDTTMGRKSWALDQKKRIQELENQLK